MWKSLALKIIITKKEKRKDTLSVPGHHSTWEWEKGPVSCPWFQPLTSKTGCPNLSWLLHVILIYAIHEWLKESQARQGSASRKKISVHLKTSFFHSFRHLQMKISLLVLLHQSRRADDVVTNPTFPLEALVVYHKRDFSIENTAFEEVCIYRFFSATLAQKTVRAI